MTTPPPERRPTADEIESWLVRRLGALRDPSPNGIDPRWSFERNGVDSLSGVTLSVELGEWLGQHLELTVVWDYPSIRDLARALGQESVEAAEP
jgi:acyl carrier protein